MKKCPNCGWQNEDERTDCLACGAPLENTAPASPEEPVCPPEQPCPEQPFEQQPFAQQPFDAPLPEEPQPRKSRKGLGVGLISGLLVVALAAVAVFLIRYYTNPMRKIAAALEKTSKALTEQFAGLPELQAMADDNNMSFDEQKYTMEINYTYEIPDFGGIYLNLSQNYDAEAARMDGNLALGIADVGALRAQYAADNDALQVKSEQLFGDTLLQGDMKELLESINVLADRELFDTSEELNLFEQQDPDALAEAWKEACAPALEAYVKSLEPEKLETSTEGTHTWIRYKMAGDPQAQQALADSVMQFLNDTEWYQKMKQSTMLVYGAPYEEQLADWEEFETQLADILAKGEFTLSLDERGYLVASEFTYEDYAIGLRLEGEENPWEKFVLLDAGKEVFTGSIAVHEGKLVFSLWIPDGDETTSVNLVYTDATGDYTLSFDSMGESITLEGTMKLEDGNFRFTTGTEVESIGIRCELTMKALAAAPQALTGAKTLDMLNMSEEESNEFMYQVQQNLMADEEIMNLLMFFYGYSGM
ncbi:MAG: zinc-ribbon domain-containing protein [Candidatus Faecousia sp.]|nr:zinc-ribbon domain-containing protein [Bacillota bacterium]MDY4220630.1 zinc-ribbon domain-containing protein [Candidatus Faecousia sp.]